MTPGYDIIGDVHGHYDALCRLLTRLDYQPCPVQGFTHPHRKLVFVGDLIDYGPQQKQTLALLRKLLTRGTAQAVMGNHEFNLVGFNRQVQGHFLRPHTSKNLRQHQAILKEYQHSKEELEAELSWLSKLPLYLNLPDFRVIHACWDPIHLACAETILDQRQRLTPAGWEVAFNPEHPVSTSLSILLKGPSITLPSPIEIRDKNGQMRDNPRAKWWLQSPQSYQDWSILPVSERHLPTGPVSQEFPGYADEKPLFIGHYWLGGPMIPRQANLACVDFSGNKQLTCYRWQGETKLRSEHFVAESILVPS